MAERSARSVQLEVLRRESAAKRPCEGCEEVTRRGAELRGITVEVQRLNGLLAPITREHERLRRAHPRCAACGVLVGPDHAETELVPEPVWQAKASAQRGQRRYDVCPSCFKRLHTSHRTVPQQRKYEAEQAALMGDELTDD